MRYDLHGMLHQNEYARYRRETAEWLKNAYKKSLNEGELSKMDSYLYDRMELDNGTSSANLDTRRREVAAKSMIMKNWEARKSTMSKAGVNTALGYNFYDLRGPVALLYPVQTPFRNAMPSVGRVNDGYGVAAHWMATRNLGNIYAGVSEGNRNAFGTPDNNQYMATYKSLGGEREVTFEAEYAGEGYSSNLADEHVRGLQALFLQEESMILFGNAGTGTNGGFALGTCPTPTIALNTVSTGGFSGSTSVSVACVLLTALGFQKNTQYGYNAAAPTVASGLTPSYIRTNADNSQDTINGGNSAISAMSSVVTCDSTHQTATAKVTAPPKGAYAYAWYVNTTDASTPALANAYLYSITTVPRVTITAAGTSPQAGNATGLSADHSYNGLDYNGLLTYTASTPGYWFDCTADWNAGNRSNNSLTPGKDGTVVEIETLLQSIYDNYQTGVDAIWGSSDAIKCLDQAVRYSGTNATGYQFIVNKDGQRDMLAGFVVSAYQSRFQTNSPTGANAIPIRMHPMLPAGTLFFDISTNPYPQSRIPYVRSLLVRRDYYSIEWPLVTRTWTFGTYREAVLAHYLPWISGCITGISTFVGN